MGLSTKDDLIFGLDIGTRTIIGIVGYKEDDDFIVIASQIREHESRAMIDGQIHDILAVARIAEKVKKDLEDQIGHPLKEVAIAAAGRVLKTIEVNVKEDFEENHHIDSLTVKGLEFKAIEKAQEIIKKGNNDQENNEYFFVGHSVIKYYLNDYEIANLEEQRGKKIGANIIATFLPKLVVESLYTVMDKIGLKVNNMTLEPIAAMNTVIPENLRMLNLALVDIGAGTSDVAITKNGSVVAYGMIPMAGDEISEKLVHKYLVDFDTAEKIKKQISKDKKAEFSDIIGISHTLDSKEIIDFLEDTVEELTSKIASKIIKLNGEEGPNAVFCVGGGSQAPCLTESLGEKLAIPAERISLRGIEHAFMVKDETEKLKGPESITPIGICITTMRERKNDFINLKVNGEVIRLLHTKTLKIADAIIEAGIDYTKIISVRGKTLMFKVNNKRVRIKGEMGTQPKILRNGDKGTLETPIYEGDNLEIHPAINGKDGKARTIDMVKKLGLEAKNIEIVANGLEVTSSYDIKYGDEIYIKELTKESPRQKSEKPKEFKKQSIIVTVNDKPITIPYEEEIIFVKVFDYIDFDLSSPQGNIVLKLNNKKASYTDVLKDGDKIDIYWDK